MPAVMDCEWTGRCEHCGHELELRTDTRGRTIYRRFCPRPRRCNQAAYEQRQGLLPGKSRAVTERRAALRAAR